MNRRTPLILAYTGLILLGLALLISIIFYVPIRASYPFDYNEFLYAFRIRLLVLFITIIGGCFIFKGCRMINMIEMTEKKKGN